MITINIVNGPTLTANWTQGMNIQTAMEKAYDNQTGTFTYSLQYYGSTLGYLVTMINETYESFVFKQGPFYFWEILLNGVISNTGIDNTVLNDGDIVTFEFIPYVPGPITTESTTHAKYDLIQKMS